jgi:broad specificity phosphatase PhoE
MKLLASMADRRIEVEAAESVQGVRTITLVRHGETEGESSIRFHGATDVPLSDVGRGQVGAAHALLTARAFDLVVSSSLCRAEESARIIAPSMPIRLEAELREIDFGRWEGLTREEIHSLDPELHDTWQSEPWTFDFPDGERRADFTARVLTCLARVLATDEARILIVAHKGVVRAIVEALAGAPPAQPQPELGGVHELQAGPADSWTTRRLL